MEKQVYFWENETVILRRVQASDISCFKEVFQDRTFRAQVAYGIGIFASMLEAEDFVSYIKDQMESLEEIWLAVICKNGEMAGICAITWMDERNGNAECGIYIFPKYRQKGYASAACRILLDYIYEERRIHKVDCHLLEGNTEGAAFARYMGFLQECERKEMYATERGCCKEYTYGMTASEYQDRKRMSALCIKKLVQNAQVIKTEAKEGLDLQAQEERQNYLKKLFFGTAKSWSYHNVTLRLTSKEDKKYWIEMLKDSMGCRFYDNDVNLPPDLEELAEEQKEITEKEAVSGVKKEALSGKAEERLKDGTGELFEEGQQAISFAVLDKMGEFVGNIKLCGLDIYHKRFSVSIYIRQKMRGLGYGKAALQFVLAYAFLQLDMHKFNTIVHKENKASLQLMKSVGCETEGLHREAVFYKGYYADEVYLGMTKEKFLKTDL